MESITIEGARRTDLGKKATNAIRHEGLIPCELYGGEENVHFTASVSQVKGIIYTPNFYKADIVVDGKHYEAIVKDVQYHPVTDEILHIDFQQLVPGVKFKTEIPIRPVGVARGVRNGGKLMINVRKLRVKATPENLLDKVEIDVTNLKLGQSFKVRDIKGVSMEILNAGSIPLVSVNVPRLLRGAGEEEEEEATAAEGAEEATAEGAAAEAAE